MSSDASGLKRLPPFSIEAEKAVLGGILIRNDTLNELVDLVKPDDFYKESHQYVYQSMIDIINAGEAIDLISLKESLSKKGMLDSAGGIETIVELTETSSYTSNLAYYAKIIRDKSIVRRLIKSAEEIVIRSYSGQEDARDLIDNAEASIFEISQSGETKGPKLIKDVIHQTFDNLAKLSKNAAMVTGVPTGFEELDKLTTGLHPGELIIIAGRPAMGKTTFGINIVHHAALKENIPSLIFSLEMTEDQLVQRMLCSEAEVDGQDLRKGFVKGEDWTRLARAAATLSQTPIYIDDTPAITVMEMRSRARRIKSKMGLDLIIVDYLQLMGSRGRHENRQMEISEISRSLKYMAKELGCPVIALSQLSRAVESRKDMRPQLSDLRESGAIEQDADVVMMLYRPEYYKIEEIQINKNKENSKGIAEVIIAKQRNGPPGSVFLAFRDNLLQFKDLYLRDSYQEKVSYPEDYDLE